MPTLTAKCGSQGRFRNPSCFLRFITAWSFESNEGCKQKGSRAAVLVLPASTIKQWTKKTIPKIIHTEMNSYQVYHICNRDRTKQIVNNTAFPEDFSTFRSIDKPKSSINREKNKSPDSSTFVTRPWPRHFRPDHLPRFASHHQDPPAIPSASNVEERVKLKKHQVFPAGGKLACQNPSISRKTSPSFAYLMVRMPGTRFLPIVMDVRQWH